MMIVLVFLYLIFSCHCVASIPDFIAGYTKVDVKNDANVFYWIYGSQSETRESDPIIIWMQGGPGGSSLLGDVCEIGPTTIECGTPKSGTPSENDYSWNKKATLIFVDQPVGTGFSYVRNPGGYVHSEKKIAEELLMVLKDIYSRYDMKKNPLWVFSESYGGKMNVYFSNLVVEAITQKEIEANFVGVGLGDTWMSPIDCVYSYSDFLLATSNFDQEQALESYNYAKQMDDALQHQEFDKATQLWGEQQEYISKNCRLNWYNINLHHSYDETNLTNYANTVMRKKFKVVPDDIIWVTGNGSVFENLVADFMQDAVAEVDSLLNEGYQVLVYSGQLDLIVDVLCTERWVYNKLKWSQLSDWKKAEREIIQLKDDNIGYRKKYKNFAFYWITMAGHMSPQDNPEMTYEMFEDVVLGK